MSIEIKDVVALTGAPGLHQVIKADERAIVIESIDERKKRQLIKGNMLISKLIDISIYTEEESTPLIEVLKNIKEKYNTELPVSKKSSKNDLLRFLEEVLPDFDKERVYPSTVKKLISWYKILNERDVVFEMPDEDEGWDQGGEEKPKEEEKESSAED